MGSAIDARAALTRMEALLADHGPDGGRGLDAACVHLARYGTRSASSVLVDDAGRVTYRVAEGRPCETAFVDVSALLDSPSVGGVAGGL